MKPLTDIERGWLAAAIDGEGSIHSKNGCAYLLIVNTDIRFAKYAQKLFGENAKLYIEERPPRKEVYRVRLHIQYDIKEILMQIEPYLLIKRDKALVAIEFCDGATSRKARHGESNGESKLTQESVDMIRAIHKESVFTQVEIGSLFDISGAQVHNIVTGKQW